MEYLNGTYTWHYISNDEKVVGPIENQPYIVCVENRYPSESEWHMVLAHWYKEGSDLTLREPDGTPHYHEINKTGFYVIHDTGDDRFEKIYRLKGVRYWTEITPPEVSTEETLTIE